MIAPSTEASGGIDPLERVCPNVACTEDASETECSVSVSLTRCSVRVLCVSSSRSWQRIGGRTPFGPHTIHPRSLVLPHCPTYKQLEPPHSESHTETIGISPPASEMSRPHDWRARGAGRDGCMRESSEDENPGNCPCYPGPSATPSPLHSQAAGATSSPECSKDYCTNPPAKGRKTCEKHLARSREAAKKSRYKKKCLEQSIHPDDAGDRLDSSANSHKRTKLSPSRRVQSGWYQVMDGEEYAPFSGGAAAAAAGSVGSKRGHPIPPHDSSSENSSDDSSDDDGVSENSSLDRAKEAPTQEELDKEADKKEERDFYLSPIGMSLKGKRTPGAKSSKPSTVRRTTRAKSSKLPTVRRTTPPKGQNTSAASNSSSHKSQSGTASIYTPNSTVCRYIPSTSELVERYAGPPSTCQYSPPLSYRFLQPASEEHRTPFCIGCSEPCPPRVPLDPSEPPRLYQDGHRQFSCCERNECASIARKKWAYFQQHPIGGSLEGSLDLYSAVIPRTPYVPRGGRQSSTADLVAQVPCMLCHRFVDGWAVFSDSKGMRKVHNFFEGHGIVHADVASCINPECNRFVSNLSMHWRLTHLAEGEQTKILPVVMAHTAWLHCLSENMDKENYAEESQDDENNVDEVVEEAEEDPFSILMSCTPMTPIWIDPAQKEAIDKYIHLRALGPH